MRGERYHGVESVRRGGLGEMGEDLWLECARVEIDPVCGRKRGMDGWHVRLVELS